MRINELCEKAHDASRRKGWYDGALANRNIGEMLALIHSEVSEALEEARVQHPSEFGTIGIRDENGKPIGFASEIADVFIRLGDLCKYVGIDAEAAIAEKMAFNETRPYRHGGKRA
jgi:NTP pyrophosphatase (non-canonical NTP hydrolase)